MCLDGGCMTKAVVWPADIFWPHHVICTNLLTTFERKKSHFAQEATQKACLSVFVDEW